MHIVIVKIIHRNVRPFAVPINWLINQTLNQSINQSNNESIDRSINRSIKQSNNQSNNQSNDQSIDQSIDRSINRTINPSINQSIERSINRPINRSIKQSIGQSNNQSNNQSNDQSNDQSIDQTINRTINRTIDQSIDQSNNQSNNQSIGQSIDQSTTQSRNQLIEQSFVYTRITQEQWNSFKTPLSQSKHSTHSTTMLTTGRITCHYMSPFIAALVTVRESNNRVWIGALPGQPCSLHFLVSTLGPRTVHSRPPPFGEGLVHVRVRVAWPPPHVLLHSPYSDQLLYPPSMGAEEANQRSFSHSPSVQGTVQYSAWRHLNWNAGTCARYLNLG